MPIARDDALSPSVAAFGGRKIRSGRFLGIVVTDYDAMGCRNFTRIPGQHRCAEEASVWPWMGVRAVGSDFAAEKRPIGMHV